MSLIKDKQIFNHGDKWDCLNRPFETKADVSEIYSFGIYIYIYIMRNKRKKRHGGKKIEPILPT